VNGQWSEKKIAGTKKKGKVDERPRLEDLEKWKKANKMRRNDEKAGEYFAQ
jgi:hypothetical protein